MTKREVAKLFEDRKIRTVWDDKEEKWYFSIVDVVGVLTDQPDVEHARNYWKVLKHRLKKEGNESVTNCTPVGLKTFVPAFYSFYILFGVSTICKYSHNINNREIPLLFLIVPYSTDLSVFKQF